MAEKYIDLHDEIADSIHWDATVADTLKWLDEHPDRAPARTITASEFDEAVESCVTEDATVPPHTFAARLGVVCVPDPEPTNAEKLADYVRQIGRTAMSAEECGKWLDEQGVKAPGGDDESDADV